MATFGPRIFALFLALATSLASGASAWAKPVDPAQLELEIKRVRREVPEFAALAAFAEKQGLRVYAFGGTAVALGEMAKYRVLAAQGESGAHPGRREASLYNLLLPTQDLDIVVARANGTPESAAEVAKIQRWLDNNYASRLGSKSRWDVTGLLGSHDRRHVALKNAPEFLQQNNDSLSRGLIELTSPAKGESAIMDLAELHSREPFFLRELAGDGIQFIRNPQHGSTSRARSGMNPELLSVVRYLIKAFQTGRTIDPHSMEEIRKVIALDEDLSSPYVQAWLQAKAPRLISDAADPKYALRTLGEIGLTARLRSLIYDRSPFYWWLRKEPLPAKRETGSRRYGATAGSLGIRFVTHETTPEVKRLITWRYDGIPRVFISRKDHGHLGETANFGDGFYTRAGTRGAGVGGQGSNVVFEVDPQAMANVDFSYYPEHRFVVWHNGEHLRVAQDAGNYAPPSFCRRLFTGLKNSATPTGVLQFLFKGRTQYNIPLALPLAGAGIWWGVPAYQQLLGHDPNTGRRGVAPSGGPDPNASERSRPPVDLSDLPPDASPDVAMIFAALPSGSERYERALELAKAAASTGVSAEAAAHLFRALDAKLDSTAAFRRAVSVLGTAHLDPDVYLALFKRFDAHQSTSTAIVNAQTALVEIRDGALDAGGFRILYDAMAGKQLDYFALSLDAARKLKDLPAGTSELARVFKALDSNLSASTAYAKSLAAVQAWGADPLSDTRYISTWQRLEREGNGETAADSAIAVVQAARAGEIDFDLYRRLFDLMGPSASQSDGHAWALAVAKQIKQGVYTEAAFRQLYSRFKSDSNAATGEKLAVEGLTELSPQPDAAGRLLKLFNAHRQETGDVNLAFKDALAFMKRPGAEPRDEPVYIELFLKFHDSQNYETSRDWAQAIAAADKSGALDRAVFTKFYGLFKGQGSSFFPQAKEAAEEIKSGVMNSDAFESLEKSAYSWFGTPGYARARDAIHKLKLDLAEEQRFVKLVSVIETATSWDHAFSEAIQTFQATDKDAARIESFTQLFKRLKASSTLSDNARDAREVLKETESGKFSVADFVTIDAKLDSAGASYSVGRSEAQTVAGEIQKGIYSLTDFSTLFSLFHSDRGAEDASKEARAILNGLAGRGQTLDQYIAAFKKLRRDKGYAKALEEAKSGG